MLLSIYGFCVFGYITATLASFFVGRDAEEKNAPVAGSADILQLKKEIETLTAAINGLRNQKS
jgi:voltage-gated potassium channel